MRYFIRNLAAHIKTKQNITVHLFNINLQTIPRSLKLSDNKIRNIQNNEAIYKLTEHDQIKFNSYILICWYW